ncbi:MAG: ABC transporter permease [Sedimentisphaerales bacterium]|nr:ABC transporter permease [Sedimentisphaerales bacterium]
MSETINFKKLLSRFQLLIVLLAMVLVLAVQNENFLTVKNIENILQQISINVCLAIGMTLVILTGGIDLSVGSVLGFSGIVMAGFMKNGIEIPSANVLLKFTFHGAVIAGLLTGLVLGLFNGLMITKFKIPPFIATLGMLSMARGWTKLWTRGEPITNLGKGFETVGSGSFIGIPIIIWIPIFLIVVFMIVSRKTRFGRHLYAVGGNEQAAALSGLRVNRIKMGAYTLCGLLSAVAALILTARLNSATVVAGETYELEAIAAVVIGGTSLSGGRGSILGTVFGCLIIGVLANGLVLMGVREELQLVVKGGVILLAVALDKLHSR